MCDRQGTPLAFLLHGYYIDGVCLVVTLLPHAGDPMRQTSVLCKCALSEREVPLSICVTAGGHMVPLLMQAEVVACAIYFLQFVMSSLL